MILEESLDIIRKNKINDFAHVTDDTRIRFKNLLSVLSDDEKKIVFSELMSVDKHSLCYVNSKLAENKGFSLTNHLYSLLNEIVPSQNKDVISRINVNNDIIYLHNARNLYSTNEFHNQDSDQYIHGTKITQRLVEDFANNESPVSKKLKELIDIYPLQIKIAKSKQGDTINGNAVFYDNKALILTINDLAFKEDNINKLPGMLAHELSHLIDATSRPQGYIGHIAGEETFADICGQIMAENAGYDSRPWARYIAEHDKREYFAKGLRPSGQFRLYTIMQSESSDKQKGTNLSEVINEDIKNYKQIREFFMADETKDRETKVIAAATTIFGDVVDKIDVSDKTAKDSFKCNKYCLMAIAKNMQKFRTNTPMSMLPNDLRTLQSNEKFIQHCLNDKNLKQYVRLTNNIDEETKLNIGTMFVMTNINSHEVNSNNEASNLSNDNHANIVIGRNPETGKPLLSAFSSERIGYHPNTFKKGYLIDLPRYLTDYSKKIDTKSKIKSQIKQL